MCVSFYLCVTFIYTNANCNKINTHEAYIVNVIIRTKCL